MQEIKALATKMKKRKVKLDESTSQLTGLNKYQHVRRIGQGMAGHVSVCQNLIDN